MSGRGSSGRCRPPRVVSTVVTRRSCRACNVYAVLTATHALHIKKTDKTHRAPSHVYSHSHSHAQASPGERDGALYRVSLESNRREADERSRGVRRHAPRGRALDRSPSPHVHASRRTSRPSACHRPLTRGITRGRHASPPRGVGASHPMWNHQLPSPRARRRAHRADPPHYGSHYTRPRRAPTARW